MAEMSMRKGGDTPSPPKRKKISEVTPPSAESCVMISPTKTERRLSKCRRGNRNETEPSKEQESSSEMVVNDSMDTLRVARRRKSPRKGSGKSPEKTPSKSPEKTPNKSPEKTPVERETGGGHCQGRVRPGNARRKLDF